MNSEYKSYDITLSHNLSAEEYRLWHILLANAQNEFYTKDEHQILVVDLLKYWSKSAKNEEDLKQSLRKLALQIKYTFFSNNHKKILGFFVLLSSIEIHKGICYYSYAKKFKELSHNSTIGSYLTRAGLHYAITYARLKSNQKHESLRLTFSH